MQHGSDLPSKLIRNSTAEFLISTAQEGGSSIEARYEDETIWLTQRLMAELFDVDVRTISEHLGNVFSSGELEREATIRKKSGRFDPRGHARSRAASTTTTSMP